MNGGTSLLTAGTSGQRDRCRTIDLAKGLAIVLVVVGHYSPDDSPGWWRALHDLIYLFHMPIFFFAAGYTWHMRPQERYGVYLKRKAVRLLVPAISVIALYLLAKVAASFLIGCEHPLTRATCEKLITDPANSFVPFVWFLYALFIVYAIFPPVHRFGMKAVWIAVFAAGAVYLRVSHDLLAGVASGLVYFGAGVLLAQNLRVDLDRHIPRGSPGLAVLAFALLASLSVLWERGTGWNSQPRYLLLSLFGVAAIVLICQAATSWRNERWPSALAGRCLLASIGGSSMTIYLFHTLFEGAAKAAFYRPALPISLPFIVKAIPCIGAGVVLPLLTEWLVLRRVGILRVLFLGEHVTWRPALRGQASRPRFVADAVAGPR